MPPSIEDVREQSQENNTAAVLEQMREALKPIVKERNVCRKRASGHVFEADSQGNYTVSVYDPLASVISYLRDQHWFETHKAESDYSPVRIYGLLEAIDICNAIANGGAL